MGTDGLSAGSQVFIGRQRYEQLATKPPPAVATFMPNGPPPKRAQAFCVPTHKKMDVPPNDNHVFVVATSVSRCFPATPPSRLTRCSRCKTTLFSGAEWCRILRQWHASGERVRSQAMGTLHWVGRTMGQVAVCHTVALQPVYCGHTRACAAVHADSPRPRTGGAGLAAEARLTYARVQWGSATCARPQPLDSGRFRRGFSSTEIRGSVLYPPPPRTRSIWPLL